MTARYVPNAAQAVVNRASMTLGNPVYVMNNTQSAGRVPTTITSSGGLVRTFIDALRSNRVASTTTAAATAPNFSQPPSTQGANVNNTVRAVRGGMNEGMITGQGYIPIGSRQAAPVTGFNMSASRQSVMRPARRPAMTANQIVQNLKAQRMLNQAMQAQSKSSKSRR